MKIATIVWEKFTVGYFRGKIVHGKIFSSLRVFDENLLTTKYFKVNFFVPLLNNLMHNHAKCILHKHRHITTIEYNFECDHYIEMLHIKTPICARIPNSKDRLAV